MKPILSCLLLISFLGLYTCRNDQDLVCTDENTKKVCQAAKDFFYFKKGSWWVYKEQITGATDSVWVSEDSQMRDNPSNSAKRTCHCGWGECQESQVVKFESQKYNNTTNEYIFAYEIGAHLSDAKTEVDEGHGTMDYFYQEAVRVMFDENCSPEDLDVDSHHNEKLDSIEVAGTIYREIIHSFYTSASHNPDWLIEAWYAKKFHLVKFRDSKGTWELEKCNIVQ
jgi:hypothetical protein